LAWVDTESERQNNHDDEAYPAARAYAAAWEPAALAPPILDVFALPTAFGLHGGILSGEYFALFSANTGVGATVVR